MPTHSETFAVAVQHLQAGQLQAADQICRQIIAIDRDHADALHLLGVIEFRLGRHEAAAEHIQQAIGLKGFEATFHSNLGAVFKAQGKLDEAVACCRRALELQPDQPSAHFNLGNAYQAQGKLDDAIDSYRRALELKPDHVPAYYNLGIAFQAQEKLDEAVDAYRRALERKPDHAEALYNMGTAFQAQGKLDEAVDSYRAALKLQPDHVVAQNNLGTALNDQGKWDEAVAAYRRALELKPDFAEAHSNLLLALQYHAGATLAGLATAHAEYERRHAAPLQSAWRPHDNVRDRDRSLRLGFVSPNFGNHPVGYFLIGALENLDRGQCETVCYSDRIINDDLTARLKAAATIWRDVNSLNDTELAEMIRADRIDILFDLAGHTAKNRLLVFARKPAPIQVTWAGYVGTTGLAAMDYILADRYEIPPEAEAFYIERVLRMPDGYVCYEPPLDAPMLSPLPALTQGFVTFGSFNNRVKMTSKVVEVWAKILNRVPRSRLVLKYRGMNDSSVAGALVNEFSTRGIDPGRVECLGFSPHRQLLAEYEKIDLALDPFPYNGGLTTCEALRMGVPVITCPGETFAGRHSLSHLSNVGLTETIARDLDEYVDATISLASDLTRLAALRAGLRQRMAGSPLCDGKRFAKNMMRVLREVWRKWCQN